MKQEEIQGQRILTLENEQLRVRICADVGASVTDFSMAHEGDWIPLMRRGPEPLTRSSFANFIMAPYSNRVKDAKFVFNGKEHQLRLPEKHAIHGDVRDRSWDIIDANETSITLGVTSSSYQDFNFPFAVEIEVQYQLNENEFSSELRIRNTSENSMPAGGGFHPYFNKSLLDATEVAELGFQAEGIFLYEGKLPFPEGPASNIPEAMQFALAKSVPEGLDHCYFNWNQEACITWPLSGRSLKFSASDNMNHVIVYTPPGESFFAFEPVTMITDGFNLMESGMENTGVEILKPGATSISSYRMQLS